MIQVLIGACVVYFVVWIIVEVKARKRDGK